MKQRIVLAIGAHYDDVELGCGGTLLKHKEAGDNVILAITNTDDPMAGDPIIRNGEQERCNNISEFEHLYYDSNMSYEHIIRDLDGLKTDILFTMYEKDTHQHHRRAARIGASVGRKRYVESYVYDSGSAYDFHPNIFSLIDKHKKEELLRQFTSQIERGTIQIDMIQKKQAYWASIVSEDHDYAEAFITKKLRYRI